MKLIFWPCNSLPRDTRSKEVIYCLSLGNKCLLGMQMYTLSLQPSRWGLNVLTTNTLAQQTPWLLFIRNTGQYLVSPSWYFHVAILLCSQKISIFGHWPLWEVSALIYCFVWQLLLVSKVIDGKNCKENQIKNVCQI